MLQWNSVSIRFVVIMGIVLKKKRGCGGFGGCNNMQLLQHLWFFGVVDVVAVGGDDDLLRSVTYFPVLSLRINSHPETVCS